MFHWASTIVVLGGSVSFLASVGWCAFWPVPPHNIWVAAVCAPTPPKRKPMINVACSLRAIRDSPTWSIACEKHQIKVAPTPPKFSICLVLQGGGSEFASVLGMEKTTKSGVLLENFGSNFAFLRGCIAESWWAPQAFQTFSSNCFHTVAANQQT